MVGPQNGVPNYHQRTTKIDLADEWSPDARANHNTALVIIHAVLYVYAKVS